MKKVLERIVAQPGAPLENEIWLDTSQNPAVMKYWDGDEWKPIAGGSDGGSVHTDVLKYSEQSLTDAQKTQARTNIGAAEAGAAGSDTWMSLLPHLTVTMPDDLTTLADNPIVLHEFTSIEDISSNDPYTYIMTAVYPGIFINDSLYYFSSADGYYWGGGEENENLFVGYSNSGEFGVIILSSYGGDN